MKTNQSRRSPKSKGQSFTLDDIKNSRFGEYFDHLQGSLEKQTKEISLYQKNQRIFDLECRNNNLPEYLENLLKEFPRDEFSCIRIIIDKLHSKPLKSGRMAAGVGPRSAQYEYLDDQIITLLGNVEKIFISDTSKNHAVKFSPGKIFPKTILGMNLKSHDNPIGIIWFASDEIIRFSKDETNSLNFITATASKAINKTLDIFLYKQKEELMELVNYMSPIPLLILEENEIILANQSATDLISISESNNMVKFGEKLRAAINGNDQKIKLGEKDFRINVRFHQSNSKQINPIVYLIDENEIIKKRDFLKIIMQTIALDFNSPLNNILGYSKMIPVVGQINEHQAEYINKISQNTRNCLGVINDLLEIERLSEENPLVISECRVDEILETFNSLVSHLVRQKRISLQTEINQKEYLIRVDRVLFIHALFIMMEYILENLSFGNSIVISDDHKNNFWKIIISDNGKGISDVELERMNQPEVESSIDPRIRLAKKILAFHGGRFYIEGELGKGTRYIFTNSSNHM